MDARFLIKPLDYQIESANNCQVNLEMTWAKIETTISMSFIKNYFYDKQETNKQSRLGIK